MLRPGRFYQESSSCQSYRKRVQNPDDAGWRNVFVEIYSHHVSYRRWSC